MIRRILFITLLSLFFIQFTSHISYADTAEVLPKGISRVSFSSEYYLPVDQRYNPDGKVEDIDADYNTLLDSNVFPDLSLVELGFGLPAGSADIGKSVVSFEYKYTLSNLAYFYGIADKLTAGVVIPYWAARNDVNASVDTASATVGKSAALASLAPLGYLDTVPLTTEDVQNLLGNGLDINSDSTIDIPGFGYERVESWSDHGIGDMEAGLRYQYLNKDDWRMAFTGGLRLPTGRVNDPDLLVDFGFGSGAYALLFHSNNDYTGIENLVVSGSIKYELILPDKQTVRVLDDPNLPLTINKENVKRDLGDSFEFDLSGSYAISKGVNVSLLYDYAFSFKDKISGKQALNYDALEAETNQSQHYYIVGVSYSTLTLYKEKKFPLPLGVSLSYRNKFAGRNNVWKSEYIGVGLQVYF